MILYQTQLVKVSNKQKHSFL